MMRYATLRRYPKVFRSMTGLDTHEFERLLDELAETYAERERQRLSRPDRQRAIGGGRSFELGYADQVLLTLIWLRQYPTLDVLGYFFDIHAATASRTVGRLLPLLEEAGRATVRLSPHGEAFRWPERKRGRPLPEILADCPELAVVIDTFEQRIQRPGDRATADRHYSGKKKQYTLKSQVAVDRATGRICDVAKSVPGPTADITLLKASGLLKALPEDVGAWGDLAYVGLRDLHPRGLGAHPRRKPRGKERPIEDRAYNTAFSRERVVVEHSLAQVRHYRSLSDPYRHARERHTACVTAVAGVINRRQEWRTA